MSNQQNRNISDAERAQIESIVHQALARCDREGFAREDFREAMLIEQKLHPNLSLRELFAWVFLRLRNLRN